MNDPYENLTISKGVTAKPKTTMATKTGSWRTFRPVIDHDTCTGCGTCDRFCPDMAAKHVGDRRYEIDLDYCKGCGICAEECPVDAIEMIQEVK
jgi:pyruvate ferredoxin oxidoreductase delta subunit